MTLTERQQEIIESAIAIIGEQGIQELTTKKLAARIGVSEPALYRHFDNKLSILTAILDHFADWAEETLRQIVQSDLPPPEKLREFFRRQTKRFAESPAASGVVFAEEIFKNENALAERVKDIMSSTEKGIMTILAEGTETGHFRTTVSLSHLATITLGTLRLLVTRWRLNGFAGNIHEDGLSLANSLLLLFSPEQAG